MPFTCNDASKMFTPKPKPNILLSSLAGRLLDIPGSRVGAAEVDSYIGHGLLFPYHATHVAAITDAFSHSAKESLEIGSAKIRSTS